MISRIKKKFNKQSSSLFIRLKKYVQKLYKCIFIFAIIHFFVFSSFAFLGKKPGKVNLKATKVAFSTFNIQIPESISINAGTPLTGAGDNTGGFGDVAANIQMAIAFKQKYPNMYVQLAILLNTETRPGVTSVKKIINTLLPEVNTQLLFQNQKISGLNIFVIPENGIEKLEKSSLANKPIIPKCDLSVQYSANSYANYELLKVTGNNHFSFHEPGAGKKFVEVKHNSREIIFSSGLNETGIYDANTRHNLSTSRFNVLAYLENKNIVIHSPAKAVLGYAYTKEKFPALIYQKAVQRLALENPQKEFILLVKKGYEQFDLEINNLRIVSTDQFSMNLGNDFIAASDLPPLVTGDSSSATALLTSRENRFALFESLPWKQSYIKDLSDFVYTRKSDVHLNNFIISNDKEEVMINKIYNSFRPTYESRYLQKAFVKISQSKNILNNTVKLFSVIKHFGEHSKYIFEIYDEVKDLLNPFFRENFKNNTPKEYSQKLSSVILNAKSPPFVKAIYSLLKIMNHEQLSTYEVVQFKESINKLEKNEIQNLGKIIGVFFSDDLSVREIFKNILTSNISEVAKTTWDEALKIQDAKPLIKIDLHLCKNLF